MPKNIIEKIWDSHIVRTAKNEPDLIYIDLHLIHEVTSPQAFDGLRIAGRTVRRPDLTLATMEFGITCFGLGHKNQGIVHVIGPELGYTQPGMTIVCGDSHTATHGAFGSIAFGIGTSEVEHVFATQTLTQKKPKTMRVNVEGELPNGVTSKDVALGIINHIGVSGGVGSIIEYSGSTIRALSMEGRMTLCNMSIEAGARAGLVAPDEVTFEYLKGRQQVPSGEEFTKACAEWKKLATDEGAQFDQVVEIKADDLVPYVTWGTNPAMSVSINSEVPTLESFENESDKDSARRALEYMGLSGGEKIKSIPINTVFIGSCTNSRIEDIRAASFVVKGKSAAAWRCSRPTSFVATPSSTVGQRCASTSNRNFEGRQGNGGRTHLVSPAVAAASAIVGYFAQPSDLKN